MEQQQGQSGNGLSKTIKGICFLTGSLLAAYFMLHKISGVDQAYVDLPL